MPSAMLVLLGGLPATGKSTIAAELTRAGSFCYLRIDSIEQALRDSGEMGPGGVRGAGYRVGYAVAGDLLRGGNDVLVECVNPVRVTRTAWRAVARRAEAALLEVELRCSDAGIHRARAERRSVDVPGLRPPDWRRIRTREYEPWTSADLRIDTAVTAPRDAAARILTAVSSR